MSITTKRSQLVQRLANDEPAFGGNLHCGDFAGARSYGDSDFDYMMIDLEHEGFDMPNLGNTLQWMISRRRTVEAGESFPSPTPVVRLPHHGSEHVRWIASQALDYGALGIVLPYTESAKDVEVMVDAMRYARNEGGKLVGERRVWPKMAMRYWGYNKYDEYREIADLWPLNPKGEMALVAILATPKALKNVDEIASVPGLSGIMFGAKHAWNAFGRTGKIDLEDPQLVDFRNKVLAACKKNGIAAGTSLSGEPPKGAGAGGLVELPFLGRRVEEGFRLFLSQGRGRPNVPSKK